MKRRSALPLAALLAALLATPALAQIRITRPDAPTAPANSAPATPAPDLSDVPAGWRVVSGRIQGPREVRLPAGSTVTITLEDVSRADAPSTTLLDVTFRISRLSSPYQIQFNPVRLSASRTYAVRARVYGPNGRLLYTSDTRQELPSGRNVQMNLRVAPVR